MAILLFKYNAEVYKSALRRLAQSGKVAVIHPTGTGNPFIEFQLCADNSHKTICWLSPSEYLFKTQLEDLKTVSSGYVAENVKFFTYAKLILPNKNEILEIAHGYILLDEFHRCGAEFWDQGVQNLLNAYPNVSILGLSASNIRFLDNQPNMADKLFDGNIASEMTFGETMVRGILKSLKYVLSVYSYQKDLEKYQQRSYRTKNRIVRDTVERYLEALRRALEKADSLDAFFQKHIQRRDGNYIVFCANKEHMNKIIFHVSECFGNICPSPNIFKAYPGNTETREVFAEFKADDSQHVKLLFCIDMLKEGIHVDDISGIILFRPTVSPIVCKQQIGRAMSANQKDQVVVFDIVNNISNLYSIGAIQKEMVEVVEYFRMKGEGDSIVNKTFTGIGMVWEHIFCLAIAYYQKNGNRDFPVNYVTVDGEKLGRLYHQCVTGNRKEILSKDRKDRLLQIVFSKKTVKVRNWMKYYAGESGLNLCILVSSQRYS